MKTKTDWIQQADNALRRAAQRARDVATLTRTPLHVMRDGKIVKLMPIAEDLQLREEAPTYGEKAGGTRTSERKRPVRKPKTP